MSATMKGFEQHMKVLQTYGRKVANSAGRKAIRAGSAVVKAATKQEVPVDEGLLKKAIDMKVTGRRGNFIGLIGADVSDLNADHEGDASRPTNIDFLVNEGHLAPDGTFVPPNGYMERGAARGIPAAQVKMEQVASAAIEKMETDDGQ